MRKIIFLFVAIISLTTFFSCSNQKTKKTEPKTINDTIKVLVGNPIITISGEPERVLYGVSYTNFLIKNLKNYTNTLLLDSLVIKTKISNKGKSYYLNNEKIPYSNKLFKKGIKDFGPNSSYTQEEQYLLFKKGRGLCDQQRKLSEKEIIKVAMGLSIRDSIFQIPNPKFISPIISNPSKLENSNLGLWNWLSNFWNYLGPILEILLLIAFALLILWLLWLLLYYIYKSINKKNHTSTTEFSEDDENCACDNTTTRLDKLPAILKAAGEAAGNNGYADVTIKDGDFETDIAVSKQPDGYSDNEVDRFIDDELEKQEFLHEQEIHDIMFELLIEQLTPRSIILIMEDEDFPTFKSKKELKKYIKELKKKFKKTK